MKTIHIAWFRQDLRIDDNPMLAAIADAATPMLAIYIHAPEEAGNWPAGGASQWWLHQALESLQEQLGELGLPLILRNGNSQTELRQIIAELAGEGIQVSHIHSSRLYEPAAVQRDAEVQVWAEALGIHWRQHNACLLMEPEQVQNQSGLPYRVFTPFWKQLRQLPIEAPLSVDTRRLQALGRLPRSLQRNSLPLNQLGLLPEIRWDTGLTQRWDASLAGASKTLQDFLAEPVNDYRKHRDLPAVDGTSSLSPYLHFGQLGPRQIWAATHAARAQENDGGYTFLSELAWREFAYHLLHHFPESDLQALNPKYAAFPWQPDAGLLSAWQQGQTGYPLVDAGMRQLWQTGWMHNRVRMVVASFLVKHLLQPWQEGARWFWDTLVDADLASNSMGWQWVAGSGADAAPYFRIFNPFGQGEKFDPDGDYIRKWLPELKQLPNQWIHRPWEAPEEVLDKAGVVLGESYPSPVIEHRAGRERALAALKSMRTA